MAMRALKANWTVQAGVIPGEIMPEYSKQWFYTSEDAEIDRSDTLAGRDTNRFTEMLKAANDYFLQINDPRRINWARIDFMWF